MPEQITIKLGKTQYIAISVDAPGSGTIVHHGLKEPCPDCQSEECVRTCSEQAERQDMFREDVKDERILTNAKIDGMLKTLLALACAKAINPAFPPVKDAIQTVLDAIGNEV